MKKNMQTNHQVVYTRTIKNKNEKLLRINVSDDAHDDVDDVRQR